MKPPSYYTSLAISNSQYPSSSNSYINSTTGNRSSSQQLRSSFSSPSSATYATRTHLPFVSQSMLVAHCFTGAGSSTKPYGQSSSYSPSSRYSPASANYSSSYSSSKSIKRHQTNPYLSVPTTSRSAHYSANYSASTPRSSSYLSSTSNSSSRTSNTTGSSYKPTSSFSITSTYYKPFRLRDRPLLTQISRQINAATSAHSKSPSTRAIHSVQKESEEENRESGVGVGNESGSENISRCRNVPQTEKDKEESWSTDVARNISRNKYLIKFREFDKRPSISPIQLEGLPAVLSETTANDEQQGENSLTDRKRIERNKERGQDDNTVTMKLPMTSKEPTQLPVVSSIEKPIAEKQLVVENEDTKKVELILTQSNLVEKQENCDTIEQVAVVLPTTAERESDKKKKAPREKKNIRLKIRALNSSEQHQQQDNEQISVVKEANKKSVSSQKELPANEQQQNNSLAVAKPKKVKKFIKTSKSNETTSEPLTNEVRDELSSANILKESVLEENNNRVTNKVAARKVLAFKQENAAADSLKAPAPEPIAEAQKMAPKTPTSSATSTCINTLTDKRIKFREYNFDDFNFLSVLGHGGWGFVILAELKEHDACFAVKCIKKITIVEDDDFDSIMIERKMLSLGNVHPFICKLFCTFETDGYLFFVMEYCAGGDLMFHVQKEGKFSESRCRFYAAEIICAIRFLHNRHIIYRDLKLDNILLDSKGHIRLVDFGMCQCRTYREEMLPSNFCGTPEYISPEIIKGVPYNHSVDWWSFGVLLYEMAVGKMPFRGNDENELLWNVCYEQIHYPMFLTKELTSLLQSLLEREPNKRMGMSTCKAGDIYNQPWFRGIDWAAIEEMRVKPPFVPEVNSKRDVQNFDADFTQSTPELSPVDESTLQKIDQSQFQRFPYTNPNIFISD